MDFSFYPKHSAGAAAARVFSLTVALSLAACGGGGGGGDTSGGAGSGSGGGVTPTTYTATCSDGTTKTSTVSLAAAQAQCPVAPTTYTATCADGSTKTSTVSLAAAQALCPVVPTSYTATCKDGTVRASQVSLADAAGKCMLTSMPTSSYTDPIKTAIFNRLNSDRLTCGFGAMTQNTAIDKAAQAHADYQAVNNISSHFETAGTTGYTGNDPSARLTAAGYDVSYASEVIAGTYQYGSFFANSALKNATATEPKPLVGLRDLYNAPYHAVAMLFGMGNREVGIGYGTKDNSFGSTTAFLRNFVINMGTQKSATLQTLPVDATLTFPCAGITDLNPYTGPESPDPFPGTDRVKSPYGTPVYVIAAQGAKLAVTSSSITLRGGAAVPTTTLTAANDPNKMLGTWQVVITPTVALAENSTYDVVINGTNSNLISASNPTGTFTKSFSFQTSTFGGN